MGKYLTKTGLTKYTTKLKEYISKAKVASAASADNAIKVNNHTVDSDVPANAKFTDTIYTEATNAKSGLLSAIDKKYLDTLKPLVVPTNEEGNTSLNLTTTDGFSIQHVDASGTNATTSVTITDSQAQIGMGNVSVNINGPGIDITASDNNDINIATTGGNISTTGNDINISSSGDTGIVLSTATDVADIEFRTKAPNEISGIAVVNKVGSTSLANIGDGTMTGAIKAAYEKPVVGRVTAGAKAGSTIGQYATAEGSDTTASGNRSHAEGEYTVASGDESHAEGFDTTASGYDSHAEGSGTRASGNYSHAEGSGTRASDNYSHAEGNGTIASGESSHAEGFKTTASGKYSHAEGCGGNLTSFDTSFVVKVLTKNQINTCKAETGISFKYYALNDDLSDYIAGYDIYSDSSYLNKICTIIVSKYLELEDDSISGVFFNINTGTLTDGVTYYARYIGQAEGIYSHAEGIYTVALGECSHAEGRYTVASGSGSHAEGERITASGNNSHAEGYSTTASSSYSHAEGSNTIASNYDSHAEGFRTTALGNSSHAEGGSTTASGKCSHAEGSSTRASGDYSHAEGSYTTASNYASHASGHYNAAMTTGGTIDNTVGTAFVIGNGTSFNALSNAFSVQFNGVVKAKSTITASTTADYAEFFEWLDGNPNAEDRVGYFVTLDGNKIRIATESDDYILGVVSGEPFVLGNGDCDTWNKMFLHDEFRRTIYEPAPKMEQVEIKENREEVYIDEETGEEKTREIEVIKGIEFKEVEGEYEGTRPVLNPEYDSTQQYVSRFDRPEWAAVGMLGVLPVRHDGTAQVNGYVTIGKNGIATACERTAENAYRVINENSDSVVEIIFR